MKTYAFRLKPGDDLKQKLEKFVEYNGIKAGFIVTCVGGLQRVTMRMAGATPSAQDIRTLEGHFEIVSLVGTISTNGTHLHISVSDKSGLVMGGHLKENSIIHPTAEIVIGAAESIEFDRIMDSETGFEELVIRPPANSL